MYLISSTHLLFAQQLRRIDFGIVRQPRRYDDILVRHVEQRQTARGLRKRTHTQKRVHICINHSLSAQKRQCAHVFACRQKQTVRPYLIRNVPQHIVLQSADRILHAQVGVRPEQRFVRAAVAEHQEQAAGQRVLAGRRAHADEAARVADAAAAERLVGGRRVAVEGQRSAAGHKRHAQRMAAERQRIGAGAQLAAVGVVVRVDLSIRCYALN